MIVWLVINVLDSKNVNTFSTVNQSQDNSKYVLRASDFVGNVSSEPQTMLMSRLLERGIIS
jgi:hypothetical protein